jgi:chromosome segregation ATPase
MQSKIDQQKLKIQAAEKRVVQSNKERRRMGAEIADLKSQFIKQEDKEDEVDEVPCDGTQQSYDELKTHVWKLQRAVCEMNKTAQTRNQTIKKLKEALKKDG